MVEGSTRYLAPVMEDKLSPASTPSLSLCERVRKKIAAMRWMAFITTCLVFVFFILFNSSISLIGVFFPIEVSLLINNQVADRESHSKTILFSS